MKRFKVIVRLSELCTPHFQRPATAAAQQAGWWVTVDCVCLFFVVFLAPILGSYFLFFISSPVTVTYKLIDESSLFSKMLVSFVYSLTARHCANKLKDELLLRLQSSLRGAH